ncbi:MAG: hypothetical protein K0S58_409 [Nitrospira sp.]|jgi:hypothetical protein|nr:hypothetical protein [Nitrospira sp.]
MATLIQILRRAFGSVATFGSLAKVIDALPSASVPLKPATG